MSDALMIWQEEPARKKRPRPERRGFYLSTKQRRFVEACCSDEERDPVRAYLTAGYAANKDVPTEARKLLEHPAVKAYLNRHIGSFSSYERTRILEGQAKCIEFWKALMDGESIHGERITIRHRLLASENLARACGLQDRCANRKIELPTTSVTVNQSSKDGGGTTKIEIVDPYASAREEAPAGPVLDAEYTSGESDED